MLYLYNGMRGLPGPLLPVYAMACRHHIHLHPLTLVMWSLAERCVLCKVFIVHLVRLVQDQAC